jgi:hypothetical protein
LPQSTNSGGSLFLTSVTLFTANLTKWATLSFDYQFVADPADNADSGPVSIFATRLHAEF